MYHIETIVPGKDLSDRIMHRELKDVHTLVIHRTGCIDDTHFTIGQDGKIIQSIPSGAWVSGAPGYAPKSTIHIDLSYREGLTAIQYSALFWLIFEHLYSSISLDELIVHECFYTLQDGIIVRKSLFNIQILINEMVARDIEYDRVSPLSYAWKLRCP
jgi:hypothetical protein